MPEEKIAPALVIIPVGLGLAGLVGIAALAYARAAPPGLIGDLNDDGVVDYDDLAILESYIGGVPISEISPLSETEFLRRADVNGDGVINALDITALEALIIAPPVCTIGETKCEGYDLYECQQINGATQWVLIEENSPQCGYVPPELAEAIGGYISKWGDGDYEEAVRHTYEAMGEDYALQVIAADEILAAARSWNPDSTEATIAPKSSAPKEAKDTIDYTDFGGGYGYSDTTGPVTPYGWGW